MPYRNRHHLSIPATRLLFNSYLERYESIISKAESGIAQQLEIGLGLTNSAAFKLVHPLLIEAWKLPRMKFRTDPLKLIGLDLETDAKSGHPKLIGLYYPDSDRYIPMLNPTLESFFRIVKNAASNGGYNGFVTWGRLDIQCVIRLFNPSEKERKRISRGLSANVKNGQIIGSPPVIRTIGKFKFYIAHYIAGRSLKLGFIDGSRERIIWIYNLSQFWQNTIAITARGLGLSWIDYPKETHLIDWYRFGGSVGYRKTVTDSNEQDARIVCQFSLILQQRFYEVFDCYPSMLVSTGSLTDAAVSKILSDSDDPNAYNSNTWKWLVQNTWKREDQNVIARAETLLAEAFSAGYVDQFAVGYFEQLNVADIASAYPHKIRALPDLRYAQLLDGQGQLDADLARARQMGYDIETAIIRGKVSIPDSLKFHPITVKTYDRENFRPVGEFYASYLLEEREFCREFGATFSEEQYIIIGLKERKPAPIATVSEKLGQFRAELLKQLKAAPVDSDLARMLDGQQYLVKVIDNSIYGKTVMTTEVVKDVDGEPVITGYITGDRFNPLYGAIITARTRIQLARACISIEHSGGQPVMCMTDSVYWQGSDDCLPPDFIQHIKTPGYFEPSKPVFDFYMLKTGQYEYKDNKGHWHYKLRGLPVDYDELSGNESLYRRKIKAASEQVSKWTHPKDLTVEVSTRRLVSIGQKNLDHLGMILEGTTQIRPFVMSGKQVEHYIMGWRECLDSHLWMEVPKVSLDKNQGTAQYPFAFLTKIYEGHVETYQQEKQDRVRIVSKRKSRRTDDLKRLYIWIAMQRTQLPGPDGRAFRLTWAELESYFGIPHQEIIEGSTHNGHTNTLSKTAVP